jgi:transcriptional regulator with XRE-family HTH domain
MPRKPVPESWSTDLTMTIGRQVKRWRDVRGMSAEKLAERVRELGHPYTRSQVNNLEGDRRRQSASVSEVLAIAAVLNIPPIELLLPIGTEDAVRATPKLTIDPWTAALWFMGEQPLPPVDDKTGYDYRRAAEPVYAHRMHDAETTDAVMWSGATDDGGRQHFRNAIRRLRDVRQLRMRDAGMIPPPLPAELADLLLDETEDPS